MAGGERESSLGYVEKCWVASKATMNGKALSSNGNYVSLMNCGIDTMNICTLGDFLAQGKDGNFRTPEQIEALKDNRKVNMQYVIPVTLPNGEVEDVIVENQGKSMCISFPGEDGNKRSFVLTDTFKNKLNEKVPRNLESLIGKEAFEREFEPRSLDEYADKTMKDELIPKSKEDSIERAGLEVDKEKTPEEQIDEEKEGKSIDEIAAEAGTTVDALQKFCDDNGIDINTILSAKKVENTEELSQSLGYELSGQSSVIAIETKNQEGGTKDNSFLATDEGQTLLNDRAYDDKLQELVPMDRADENVKDVEDSISITEINERGEIELEKVLKPDPSATLSPDVKELYAAEVEKQNARIYDALSQPESAENAEIVVSEMVARHKIDERYGMHDVSVTNETEKNVDTYLENSEKEKLSTYIDENGNEVQMTVEENHVGDAEYYKKRLEELKNNLKTKLEEINSDESLSPYERAKAVEEAQGQHRADIVKLTQETGIESQEVDEQSLSEANKASDDALKAGAKEVARKSFGT